VTTIDHETTLAPGVPLDMLEALLRNYLADQTAVIVDYASTPLSHQGTNDSNSFFRVTFTWERQDRTLDSHIATWIVKHWSAGGARDSALGISQPREVLAWEQGWLRPDALPDGIHVPFISAWRAPDNSEAWLAMADIAADLAAYSRMGLSGEQVISRAKIILARLAQFHALWEQPARQAELQTSAWLRHPEGYPWELTPADRSSADLEAFLEDRPLDERRLWEHLLQGRRALAKSLAQYPPTLLHNDLDDRNIGLCWFGAGSGVGSGAFRRRDLVLIDWEWIAIGPAAIDVARIIQFLPVMLTPGSPIPEAFWNNELADYYYAHYRAAGGKLADTTRWRRSYGLALVAQALTQMPFIHGSLRRAIRGDLPPPSIIGVPEAVIRQNLRAGLPMMEQMEQLVVREARRWLGSEN
jgi:hypothetical protein